MQIEQMVSVVIRMIASFYLVRHVGQFAFSAPMLLGEFASGGPLGASSFLVWGSYAIIAVEIVAFAKSRTLAQWLLKGA